MHEQRAANYNSVHVNNDLEKISFLLKQIKTQTKRINNNKNNKCGLKNIIWNK